MSTLQGNFKREIKKVVEDSIAAGKGQDIRRGTCPQSQVRPDFHDKTYSASSFQPNKQLCDGIREDERIDFLFRMKNNITEYFENTVHTNPYGLTAHDYKSVRISTRGCLEDYKMKVRRENYTYLSKHPEIDAMIELLLRKLMTELPCDPVKATAEFFCLKSNTYDEHKKKIDQEREKIIRYRKSKSKEFFLPKPEPVVTIRKLNLGPLADILEFSKPAEKDEDEEEEADEDAPFVEALLEGMNEDIPSDYKEEQEEEEEGEQELPFTDNSYNDPSLYQGQIPQTGDFYQEERDADGNLLNNINNFPENYDPMAGQVVNYMEYQPDAAPELQYPDDATNYDQDVINNNVDVQQF